MLATLCLSLLIVGIDGTIVNVALPTLVRELGATSSQLQWIVDAYTIIFASFLLLAGNTGDRLGRKGALLFGLVVFGAGSLASTLAGSASVLILTRGIQGFGGAFIMPSTLSILTNVFPDPTERTKAISIWAGVSGLGVAIGPLAGGFLLEHFWWGSIFLVNVPVIVVAFIGVALIVPRSKDPNAPRLDFVGTILATTGLVAVLYGVIEGPTRGWTDPVIVVAFVGGAALLTAFAFWELHSDHPILDITFFANPRFSAASLAVTLVFFAMFGCLFFLSQYMQFVLGYDALKAGAALIPLAAVLMIVSPLSARLVGSNGTKRVVTAGLALAGIGLLVFSLVKVSSGYGLVVTVLIIVGAGMALAMAPATDSIMGSLPPERAGVGSAVNDTTREIGGALGVAILGSITSAVYRSTISSQPGFNALASQAPQAAAAVKDSVGNAAQVAAALPGTTGTAIVDAANSAFVHALRPTSIVGAVVAFGGALIAYLYLPARPVTMGGEANEGDELVIHTAQRLPADLRRRRDLTDATLGLLADSGFSSLTFSGIATRSGISTATLERYWSSRVDAVTDAIHDLFQEHPVPDTGRLRTDCETYLRGLSDALSTPRAAAVIGTLVGEASSDADLAHELRERIVSPRRSEVVEMIRRGIARGELPSTVDAEARTDLLVAPLYHRLLFTGAPMTPAFLEQLVDAVCAVPDHRPSGSGQGTASAPP